jgi:hypothetical protein
MVAKKNLAGREGPSKAIKITDNVIKFTDLFAEWQTHLS